MSKLMKCPVGMLSLRHWFYFDSRPAQVVGSDRNGFGPLVKIRINGLSRDTYMFPSTEVLPMPRKNEQERAREILALVDGLLEADPLAFVKTKPDAILFKHKVSSGMDVTLRALKKDLELLLPKAIDYVR